MDGFCLWSKFQLKDIISRNLSGSSKFEGKWFQMVFRQLLRMLQTLNVSSMVLPAKDSLGGSVEKYCMDPACRDQLVTDVCCRVLQSQEQDPPPHLCNHWSKWCKVRIPSHMKKTLTDLLVLSTSIHHQLEALSSAFCRGSLEVKGESHCYLNGRRWVCRGDGVALRDVLFLSLGGLDFVWDESEWVGWEMGRNCL